MGYRAQYNFGMTEEMLELRALKHSWQQFAQRKWELGRPLFQRFANHLGNSDVQLSIIGTLNPLESNHDNTNISSHRHAAV